MWGTRWPTAVCNGRDYLPKWRRRNGVVKPSYRHDPRVEELVRLARTVQLLESAFGLLSREPVPHLLPGER